MSVVFNLSMRCMCLGLIGERALCLWGATIIMIIIKTRDGELSSISQLRLLLIILVLFS